MFNRLPARLRSLDVPILLAVALVLARASWDLAGMDMREAYLPWFDHIRSTGPVAAFAVPFSNYTPSYLYLLAAATPLAPVIGAFAAVKLVSYLGHFALALAVYRLLRIAGCAHPGRWAVLIALAPSLFVSPAILVQCDAYWAAALVMAMAAAMQRRSVAMFLWCGIAVGFKLQAGFAAPLFLAIALAQRIPVRTWLLAPAAFIATLVPAWLAGWPAADLLTIYLRQVGYSDALSLNAPNIWALVDAVWPSPPVWLGTIGSLAAILASLAFVAVFARRLRDADAVQMLGAASLCALIVPGLLPRMHERYFFFADVTTLALFALDRSRWRVAALTELGSAAAIAAYIVGAPPLAMFGAVSMMAATWLALRRYRFFGRAHDRREPALAAG